MTTQPTRRAMLRAGFATTAGAALAAVATTARAQTTAPAMQKLTQAAVMYQAHPKDGKLCSICSSFRAPNACILVEGTISPVGYCVAFAPKAS